MTATLEPRTETRTFQPSVVCVYATRKGECGRTASHYAVNPIGFRFGRCDIHAPISEKATRTDPRYREWRVEPIGGGR